MDLPPIGIVSRDAIPGIGAIVLSRRAPIPGIAAIDVSCADFCMPGMSRIALVSRLESGFMVIACALSPRIDIPGIESLPVARIACVESRIDIPGIFMAPESP